MKAPAEYSRKLRERLTGRVIKPLQEATPTEVKEEVASKPFGFWNKTSKQSIAESIKKGPFAGWEWSKKLKAKVESKVDDTPKRVIQEKKEVPTPETNSGPKYQVI